MKQHALIGLADLENVTNLRCRPTLDITQADHHTLSRWQNIDCRRDHRARLRRLELDLRPLAPRQREREPTPGIGPVGTEKPIDRDSPLIISSFGLKRRQRHRSCLPNRLGFRDVRNDLKQPRRQRGTPLKTIQTSEHGQPRVLHHVIRHGGLTHESHANRRIAAPCASTSSTNARSSPARSAASRSSSEPKPLLGSHIRTRNRVHLSPRPSRDAGIARMLTTAMSAVSCWQLG
jgi:hypothetical protein